MFPGDGNTESDGKLPKLEAPGRPDDGKVPVGNVGPEGKLPVSGNADGLPDPRDVGNPGPVGKLSCPGNVDGLSDPSDVGNPGSDGKLPIPGKAGGFPDAGDVGNPGPDCKPPVPGNADGLSDPGDVGNPSPDGKLPGNAGLPDPGTPVIPGVDADIVGKLAVEEKAGRSGKPVPEGDNGLGDPGCMELGRLPDLGNVGASGELIGPDDGELIPLVEGGIIP